MTDRCTTCGLEDAPVYDDEGRCPLCTGDTSQNDASNTDVAGRVATILKMNNPPRLTLAAAEAILEHDGARAAGKALGCNHGVLLMALDGKETDAAYRALGVRKTQEYLVTFRFSDEPDAVALRQLFDRHGETRREVGRKLLSGELRLMEVE